MNRRAALSIVEAASGDDADTVPISIPEIENPVILGRAVSVMYRTEDGEEYVHDFRDEAIAVVDDGILAVIEPSLTVSDLGLEESD